jgi:predicted dehydrogenase
MKILIVGMGFGNLYKAIHEELGHEVVTVDTNGKADYLYVGDAGADGPYDMAHICTPNYTHELVARVIAPFCEIVVVEKPGVENALAWSRLVKENPKTRFMMSKNNMWRDNIAEMYDAAEQSGFVRLHWINKDRVPNPGSWFTTKSLAYGGISRDLMPHLLSLYIALNPNWISDTVVESDYEQRWTLDDMTNTDYGKIAVDGEYDVDDYAMVSFGDKWLLLADWRDTERDRRTIECDGKTFELGLCPESAYKAMIQDALVNVGNEKFWETQYSQDIWIHTIIDTLWK